MKKKVLNFVLVLVLVNIMPVSAEIRNTAVSQDPQVQAAYDAYIKIKTELEEKDIAELETAYTELEAALDAFTEAQSTEYETVVEENLDPMEYLTVCITAAFVLNANRSYEAYTSEPSVKAAVDFVEAYDMAKDSELNVEEFVQGIDTAYQTAKDSLTDNNAVKVYEAYTALSYALNSWVYDEDYKTAFEGFKDVLDIYNELQEEDMNDLAALLEEDSASDAFSRILSDWVYANLIVKVCEAEATYYANPDAETAKDYVEAYESVFLDTEIPDEDKEFLASFCDVTIYEEAKAFSAEEPDDQPDNSVVTVSKGEAAPQTDVGFNMVLFAAFMIAAAAVMGVIVKKRQA